MSNSSEYSQSVTVIDNSRHSVARVSDIGARDWQKPPARHPSIEAEWRLVKIRGPFPREKYGARFVLERVKCILTCTCVCVCVYLRRSVVHVVKREDAHISE